MFNGVFSVKIINNSLLLCLLAFVLVFYVKSFDGLCEKTSVWPQGGFGLDSALFFVLDYWVLCASVKVSLLLFAWFTNVKFLQMFGRCGK